MWSHRAAITVAAAALLAAGCGSANQNTAGGTNTGQSFQSFVSAAYKHARCMRSHGIPNYPDPKVHLSGAEHGITQELIPGMVNSKVFKAADQACKGLLPDAGHQSAAELAAQQHAHLETRLAFARCLRSHGVRDFPDPTPQGQLSVAMVQAAGVDLQAPSFLTAARACVGVTNGELTIGQIEQAIHNPNGVQSSGGG